MQRLPHAPQGTLACLRAVLKKKGTPSNASDCNKSRAKWDFSFGRSKREAAHAKHANAECCCTQICASAVVRA